MYIVAIQGIHGAELITGACGFERYDEAVAYLKYRKEKGSDYLRIFEITCIDDTWRKEWKDAPSH